MLRPGLHFNNACGITAADMDIIKRWAPLSLLEAMDNVVAGEADRLRDAWELAGRPPVVLRRYYYPRRGGPSAWGAHAVESVGLARTCIAAGIPVEYLMVKPFNEPNMPAWANWEGFGDTEEDMVRYNQALNTFIDVAKNELPEVRIGGPHLTVGNRDVRFPSDPPGVYYYHGADMKFESSPCAEALRRLDVHFVHCYGFCPGEYRDRAHGLRFLEYEKYLQGNEIYVVEGAYGTSSGLPADRDTVRGEETVAYLKLLGEEYPQVKGIALWIGGDRDWFTFRHSEGADPSTHRPVVYAVEKACREEPAPPPAPPPGPTPDPPGPGGYKLVKRLQVAPHGFCDLRSEIESFSNLPLLAEEQRDFSRVTTLVIHHSGSDAAHTPLSVARWHVLEKPGQRDPTTPYHFCVDQQARLFFTARLTWSTYHSGHSEVNRSSVGICVLGDFSARDPSTQQVETLRWLIAALGEFFGGGWGQYRGLYLAPHGMITATACPGRLREALVWQGDWLSPIFADTRLVTDYMERDRAEGLQAALSQEEEFPTTLEAEDEESDGDAVG
jgi:hypothetical protein